VLGEDPLTPPLWVLEKGKKESGLLFKSMTSEPEYVVGGVVYPANMVDLEGDTTDAEEIWKMMKHFLLRGRKFSIEHHGKMVELPILEAFQAEVDTVKGGEQVPAGSFWMSVSLEKERELFEDVRQGKINGWSIEGTAVAERLGDDQ